MKFIKESLIILSIYFIGEFTSKGFNLLIPGNIIGMILLLVLLLSGILKLEKIETISNFFLDNLAFFFIPAGIGLMDAFIQVKGYSLKILFICIITTVIVMVTTGLIIQHISKKKEN